MPRVWLFDLDNTLHDASASAFRHLDTAMNAYIERELAVSAAEADRLETLERLIAGAAEG